jgi:hypothetical protein
LAAASAKVPRSYNAVELTFLDNPFVRLGGIFYPVLIIIAFGWQEVRDGVDAIRATATERAGRKAHRLTDFEFVLGHAGLHDPRQYRVAPLRWNAATSTIGAAAPFVVTEVTMVL